MKKTISISLAVILLFGSVGITYGSHTCGGLIVKGQMMLGEEHLDCGMDMSSKDDMEQNITSSDCCQNEYTSVDTKDLLEKSIVEVLGDTFIATVVASVLYDIDLDFNSDKYHVVDTSPPYPDPDILVLHQVFRI